MLMKIKMFQVSVLDEVLRKGNFYNMFIREEGPIKMLILDHRRGGGGCLHDNKIKKIFVKL